MAQAAATVAVGVGQFGDTTLTKVFVGGLAWATQKEGMRSYFEQFGEILEAVVITDKNTGRSKGYGFVTFREPDAAMRACFDPYPVIDGRRANCNLAYLGVHKSKTAPTTLKPYVGGGRNMQMRVMKSTDQLMGSGGGGGMSFADHGIQQGIPAYNVYGYSPHFSDYGYPLSYYQAYGGLGAPYQAFGGGATAAAMAGAAGLYPYFQYSPASAAAGGYSTVQMQYPQMYQYAAVATTTASLITATGISGVQQFGGAVAALTPTSTAPAGMTASLTAPILPTPTPHHYRLIPSHLSAAAAATPEQSLA